VSCLTLEESESGSVTSTGARLGKLEDDRGGGILETYLLRWSVLFNT